METQGYVIKNQKKLRLGITTGTCSAAAAQAAAMQLLGGITTENVCIRTPKGITVSVPVSLLAHTEQFASCKVIKDSGDDPDVTNKTDVCVTVAYVESGKDAALLENDATVFRSETYPNLILDGGIGIGRVTKEGLEQKVGQAAINVVPRAMIFDAVGDVCDKINFHGRLKITVWMPEGEQLAKKTFNPKLGIEGGLSVLGTSGILEPMSERAIVDTIETEIRQLHATGENRLLITPGNYGQAYASEYLKLDLSKSVKSSNYIGDTLDLAVAYDMKYILLVGNIGKLVKLAAGIFNTHSKVADGRGEIFASHAAIAGASPALVQRILDSINTDAMLTLLETEHLREVVMQRIVQKIEQHVEQRLGTEVVAGVCLFSEKYGYLGATTRTREVLDVFQGGQK